MAPVWPRQASTRHPGTFGVIWEGQPLVCLPTSRHMRRLLCLLVLSSSSSLAAQEPRRISADDYARAERFLAANTTPLVSGTGVTPTWLEDGRFWYRTGVPGGSAFFVVDPVRRTRQELFDQGRLASALGAALGGTVTGNQLPFRTFDLSKDGRSITISVRNRRWSCDLQLYTCAPADSSRVIENSVLSPDGRRTAFIRDHNLWMRDVPAGRETRLTVDGVKDFGYATDNAGWTHSDNPVVTWSPDSRQIATFQHDGRGVPEMYLVETTVGAPRLQSWKYPIPGDSVIFRVSRVIINT